jgi:hypothetical protein
MEYGVVAHTIIVSTPWIEWGNLSRKARDCSVLSVTNGKRPRIHSSHILHLSNVGGLKRHEKEITLFDSIMI